MYSRKQRVGINGFFSQWFSVDIGIPYMEIYINDLPEFCGVEHKIYLIDKAYQYYYI